MACYCSARPSAADGVAAGRRERVFHQLSMLTDALDVSWVARQLGVDPTRVRQRLREGSLYGLRGGSRTWLLPRWQFGADDQPIPHLREVPADLPVDLHPRSVAGFFDTPQPEPVIDGETCSPRDWLMSGGPAGRHPLTWNEFRTIGPVAGGRFDHHEPGSHRGI